jgi:HAMP domain-containing protein
MRYFSSLRFRLLLLVLLAVIPALGLTLYTASEDRQRETAAVQENVLRLAGLVALQEEQLISGTYQLLRTLAYLPAVREGDSAACSALFADFLEHYHRYDNFGAIGLNGDVFCSALPTSGPVNAADRTYFRRAVETHDFAVGDYQIGRITGKSSINFGYPVLDDFGQVQAVVFAALDLVWLVRFESEVETQLPLGSTLTKTDPDGVVLARYPDPEKWVGQPAPEMSLLETMLTRRQGVVAAPNADGLPRLYAFTPVRSTLLAEDVYVILGIPEEAALAEVNHVLARNLISLGLMAALALTAAWVGGDLFILRPVNALLNATRRLGAGELSARSGPPYGSGELGQLARTFDQMAEVLQERDAELTLAYDTTLEGWARALELRDLETEGHTQRVTELAIRLARAMGVPEAELVHVRRGALLHDIGKMGIPDSILLKPGKLTDEEWQVMRRHPAYVFEMLLPIRYLRPALDIPYCHHEKWDGSGYPRGLKGEEIPLAARIFAVVDVWDALRSDRPYREAWSDEKALKYIREQAGKHFDPRVVEAFLQMLAEAEIYEHFTRETEGE